MVIPGAPERSPWRFPAAAAASVAALAHVPVTGTHLREAPYMGVLFIALELALLLLAVALLVADRPVVWLAAGVVPAAAIAGYALSRTVALPQLADDVGNWAEPLGVVAVGFEALCVLVVAGRHRVLGPVAGGSARPAAVTVAVLGLGLAATGTSAAAGGPAAHGTAEMTGMARSALVGAGYWDEVAGAGTAGSGVVRRYYVSADPVPWNYVPSGRNRITGARFDDTAKVFVGHRPGRIGPRYVKCLYRGYTDATFAHRLRRPAAEAYLGILGPVIRAAVGDTIRIVFRNTCPFPTSMHPHGVFYAKASEGAPYADGSGGRAKADDAVRTGGRVTYTWKVPPRAGPGPHDGSSVMWMYHSHTDEIADTYAGLIGPMVVTRAGMARADGSPRDVDRELFLSFFIDNETLSPLLAASEQRFGTPPFPADPESDEEFVESNLKHSVNGYLYGNMPLITLARGDHVRWYVMSMGTEVDLHTPHWHGNVVTVDGMRMDVVDLLPASMVIADMVPDDPGTWLLHCHVNDHITAGMQARYRVLR